MRGGKRAGAGRLPDVSATTAKFIRRDYEQRRKQKLTEQAQGRIVRGLVKLGVDWRKDKKGRAPTELGNPDWEPEKLIAYRRKHNQTVIEYGRNPGKRIPENLPTRVEEAINAVRDGQKTAGKRYSAPLPKKLSTGERKKIIADLARTYEVSERRIRTIIETKA